MHRNAFALAVSLFLSPAVIHADPLADDNARLRQEVQDLQQRNEALQKMCVANSGTAPAATPAAPMASAAVSPAASVPLASAAAASAVPPASAEPAPSASVTTAAPFSQTIAKKKAAAKKPYANAGCDQGLFSGPDHERWQKNANWKPVVKGASMQDVETALGAEHYDVDQGDDKVQWEYGSCGSSWEGAVVFLNGKVVSVTPPDH